MSQLFITETIEYDITELKYLLFYPMNNKGFVNLCIMKDQKSFNDNFLIEVKDLSIGKDDLNYY